MAVIRSHFVALYFYSCIQICSVAFVDVDNRANDQRQQMHKCESYGLDWANCKCHLYLRCGCCYSSAMRNSVWTICKLLGLALLRSINKTDLWMNHFFHVLLIGYRWLVCSLNDCKYPVPGGWAAAKQLHTPIFIYSKIECEILFLSFELSRYRYFSCRSLFKWQLWCRSIRTIWIFSPLNYSMQAHLIRVVWLWWHTKQIGRARCGLTNWTNVGQCVAESSTTTDSNSNGTSNARTHTRTHTAGAEETNFSHQPPIDRADTLFIHQLHTIIEHNSPIDFVIAVKFFLICSLIIIWSAHNAHAYTDTQRTQEKNRNFHFESFNAIQLNLSRSLTLRERTHKIVSYDSWWQMCDDCVCVCVSGWCGMICEWVAAVEHNYRWANTYTCMA